MVLSSFFQSTYLYVFFKKATVVYWFMENKSSCRNVFNLFLLFCEIFFSGLRGCELFFIVFGLISLSWNCSFCGIYLTLLSIVIFRNVIYFEENINVTISFDSIMLKQQIENHILNILSGKMYINNSLHNKNLFHLSDLVFCIQFINSIQFVL